MHGQANIKIYAYSPLRKYLCVSVQPHGHKYVCGQHADLSEVRRSGRLRLKCDGTRAETIFRLSAKRTSPFKSAGASVQSTTGSRGVLISGSSAGYTMFRGSVRSTGYHSIRHFPLHFPSRASPCAVTFQLDST